MYYLLGALALFLCYVLFFKKSNKQTEVQSSGSVGAAAPATSSNDAVLAATIGAAVAAREDEIVAVITAALACHGLTGGDRIVAVKPLASSNWKVDARSNVVHQRDQMF